MILAAGESRRMGRPKAHLPFRGGTFLSVLAETLGGFCSPVIAVFGTAQPAPNGVIAVVNAQYHLGMLTSLQAALRACPDDFDAVLFTLVDHPAVRAATVALLLNEMGDAPVVIPRFQGKRGHPVLIRSSIALEYLAEPITAKVRDVIDRHADSIRYVEVDDPGVCDDVDDPALYAALLAREAASV